MLPFTKWHESLHALPCSWQHDHSAAHSHFYRRKLFKLTHSRRSPNGWILAGGPFTLQTHFIYQLWLWDFCLGLIWLSSVILWFFVWSSHLSPSACPQHNTFSWKPNMPIVQAGGSLRPPPQLNPNREEKLIMHCMLQFTVCYTGTDKHKNHIKESGAQQIIIIIRWSNIRHLRASQLRICGLLGCIMLAFLVV